MANTTTNVTTGKPKVTGGIYRAPLGTALPTDATTALASAYESVGYVANDGVTNNTDMQSNNYRAWGGDLVISYMSEKTDTFEFGLIEELNPLTHKIVNGDTNVSGTLATGITVRANSTELESAVYVFEMLLRDGAVERIVVPNGKVTAVGEVAYKDDDVIVYPITITGQAGADGDTHKKFILKAE